MLTLYSGIATTGLDFYNDDIIKLTLLVEENGKEIDQYNTLIRPRAGKKPSDISKEALDLNNVTIEELRGYNCPRGESSRIVDFLVKHIDRAGENFCYVGHYIDFDLRFLNSYIKRYTGGSIYDLLNSRRIDLMNIIPYLEYMSGYSFRDRYTLTDICNQFNISYIKYNTESKCRAIRELNHRIIERLKGGSLI
jgi:DNA polymerase III alpha subunit (gram-positive type)